MKCLPSKQKIEKQRSKKTSTCSQGCGLAVDNNVGETHGSNHGKDNKQLVTSSNEKEKDKRTLPSSQTP
uniref:Putative ovule protein n=1 Tax=Solanum chacoense TaxID=4108 RepID=A0A0V0HCQ3_SOLCH